MRCGIAVASALLLTGSLFAGVKTEPAKPGAAGGRPDFKALAATAPVAEADRKLPTDNDFVVHEWGTFTSFSGSDGVSLDFRPLVDEDLPAFVLDRPKQAFVSERRDLAYARGRSDKGLVISRQRMETPVTYFYTDKERIVDVAVEFPRGLLTEFYPPVRQFGPAYKRGQAEPLENSWLRWGKVRLLPQEQAIDPKLGVDPLMPKVKPEEGGHYAYARETDSAHVQITDPAMLTTHREKFLFYRGVGNFDLPVALRAEGDDRFTLTHSGKTPLSFAFLVQIDAAGAARFAKVDEVSGSRPIVLPAQGSTVEALAEAMVAALVSDGLYEKEARSMVKTWRSSWFGEPGTRVLYSLPQADTDALLPLRLDPAPRQVVRVMIGRLETLTPEQERRIESLIGKLGADDPSTRDAVSAELKRLGRFAEPALTRVAKLSDDPEAQARAKTLLRSILSANGIPVDGDGARK
jgi:hypothetical protein